jgi:oxygen-independent coproporphyrinogen-3 oxidase
MNRSGFDPDLVRQFGDEETPATAYPPASLFRADFEPIRYLQTLQTLPASPLLALRIVVPAAGMLDAPGAHGAVRFEEHLYREAALISAFLPSGHRVTRMDLCGGATTALSDSQLSTLCAALRERFNFVRGAGLDFSIALGSDPDPARMSSFAALGINAGVLTIPDIDPAAELARRAQSVAATRIAIAAARREGIRRIDIELSCGQPRQTPARLADRQGDRAQGPVREHGCPARQGDLLQDERRCR